MMLPSPSVFNLPDVLSLTLLACTYDKPHSPFPAHSLPRLRALHTDRPVADLAHLNRLEMLQVPFSVRDSLLKYANLTRAILVKFVSIEAQDLVTMTSNKVGRR